MVNVFLADGFEDMEAVVAIDVLKRTGMNVRTVGLEKIQVVSCSGFPVFANMTSDEIRMDDIEAIVLPGGMPGTTNLDNCKKVHNVIDYCVSNNILIGAICAAPMILGKKGLLKGKRACCFPGFERYLDGALLSGDAVCCDGNIVTARGPGVAMKFALELVKSLHGEETMRAVKLEMQC